MNKPQESASSAIDYLATTVVLLQRKLDAAVLAERERCAKIAEDYHYGDIGNSEALAVRFKTKCEIAAAIRSGK